MVKVHIAVLMMVKNEHKRLNVSLESVKDFADSLVIFDTGSTDDTVQICENFSKKYNIPLRLKEGDFVNFSTSRNVSLDFADSFEDVDYLLLMDTNDELKGGKELRKFAEDHIDNNSSGFLLAQEWWSGSLDTYYNTRFIKAHKEWRYIGSVHEYMKTKNLEYEKHPIIRIPLTSSLYQDRTQDDDKTSKRFERDRELLLADYERDPTEPRTVFYLAQTYSCLNDIENAYKYYALRVPLEGFWEERFQAMLKCGDLSEKLKYEWYNSMTWYIKSFEHTARVEPLLKIADHYRVEKNWILAFTFIDLACKLTYPDHCILFVDKLAYEYKRWHLMGIIGFYAQQYKEGKIGCLKAIENGKKCNINTNLDMKNLDFYDKKEKELNTNFLNAPNNHSPSPQTQTISPNAVDVDSKDMTKNQFISAKLQELKVTHPRSTDKQLIQIAKMHWKNRKI